MNQPLEEAAVRKLAQRAPDGRVLPVMYLQIAEAEGEAAVLVQCVLIYVRSGGFMIGFPASDGLEERIRNLPQAVQGVEPLFHAGTVDFETSRGRRTGNVQVVLADLPWEFAQAFFVSNRLTLSQKSQLLGFQNEAGPGRPTKAGILQLAQDWLDNMDPLTAQDYFTGEELSQPEESTPELQEPAASPLAEENARLRARVKELEGLQTAQVPAMPPATKTKAPSLFAANVAGPSLSTQEWARLQLLAGSPPPRVGAAEKRRQTTLGQQSTPQDHALVELQREAVEEEPEVPLLPDMTEMEHGQLDPMQRFLMMQMQQNQVLLQKLVGNKTSDPVLGALTGGGSDSGGGGGSSSGVKGCLARDAFMRTIAELPKVANNTRMNALKELGLDPSREDRSLMKKYMERRMPLQEHKLLTYFTSMLAEAWAIGYDSGNMEMLGVLSRMLYFAEQCSIDQGRTQMAWLLTGWQDPPFHLLTLAKRHPGLQPYARLCNPAWVSANIAYIKDIDYLESRLQTLGQKSNARKPEDPDAAQKPAAKPKPRKPKGGGKTGKDDSGKGDASNSTA